MQAAPEVNPFYYPTPVTPYERIKLVVLGVTLFPIRFVCFMLLLILAWLCAVLSNIGATDMSVPTTSWWRKALRAPIAYLSRGMLFCAGYYWIKTKGQCAPVEQASILVVAPHSGFMDILYMVWAALPCGVSMQENLAVPFIGSIIQGLQMITVDRASTNSRHETMEKIVARTKDSRWPHTLIYPEGICTNRQALCQFKQGAFAPGAPVQPVCLRYPHQHYNYCWVNGGPGMGMQIFRQMCQFVNYMEVEYLPVYTPSKEEIADPTRYADNVRRVMARALEVPVTNHGFEDMLLTTTALRGNFPSHMAAIEVMNLKEKGIHFKEANVLLKLFMRQSKSSPGTLNIAEFQALLELSDPVAAALFKALNETAGATTIGFRDLIYNLACIYHEAVKGLPPKKPLMEEEAPPTAQRRKKGEEEALVLPQFVQEAISHFIEKGATLKWERLPQPLRSAEIALN